MGYTNVRRMCCRGEAPGKSRGDQRLLRNCELPPPPTTPTLRLKTVRRPQLCDWVTRVHDQAGVNLLRDEGERNCVMPFFDQSNQGSVSDNIDTLKWVRHRIFERPFISHLRAV